ncbi:hypothetical protein [Sulfurimonas sp.]
MALEKDDLKVGERVYVGLFEGKVVRVIPWHNVTMVDVEMDGVIDRYDISHVKKIDE